MGDHCVLLQNSARRFTGTIQHRKTEVKQSNGCAGSVNTVPDYLRWDAVPEVPYRK